eukprot:CAMPEP_0196596036 /NCGR_PEP_ID=MMETSP1081-20130531/83766_1 /TAXON_ID=36882 /ORGANISM="Pyramimonas amylifera, Strain CCMP720" /LENGTH=295 /DNA_ID=CAMNT_0041920857 /DNA_START=18 /DNA_END=905 /DNA_ORIENTATION=+
MEVYPRYASAWFELALVQLDEGPPHSHLESPVTTLETLLRVDRDFPGVQDWLTRAHGRARRGKRGSTGNGVLIGDRVRMRDRVPDFWAQHEEAEIVSLGTPSAPSTVRLLHSKRLIHVRYHDFDVDQAAQLGGGPNQELSVRIQSIAVDRSAAEYQMVDEDPTNYYSILRVPADFTGDELKRAYREASRRLHPDKGGSAGAFENAVQASEILSDPIKKKAYDEGEDVSKLESDSMSLKKEIERRYFPDNVGFLPFGDPLENKKETMERRERTEKLRLERIEMMAKSNHARKRSEL